MQHDLFGRAVLVLDGPRQTDVLRLDGDAALALDVHAVEVLSAHRALLDDAGELQHPVRESRLAVVDVRDDAEVPDLRRIRERLLRKVAAQAQFPRLTRALTSARSGRPSRTGPAPGSHRQRPVPSHHPLTVGGRTHRGSRQATCHQRTEPSRGPAPRACPSPETANAPRITRGVRRLASPEPPGAIYPRGPTVGLRQPARARPRWPSTHSTSCNNTKTPHQGVARGLRVRRRRARP